MKEKERAGLVLVRFSSHRSRVKGLAVLGRQPQGYYSLRRDLGVCGVYAVTPAELATIKEARIKGVAQTHWSDCLHQTVSWS